MSRNVWLNFFALGCLVFTSPTASANEDKLIASKSPIVSAYQSIKLTRAYAIDDTVQYHPASYQFTIKIPPTIKHSLARLTIDVPDDNSAFGMELPEPNNIRVFNPTDSESLLPHYSARDIPARITLEKRTVGLDFDPPLSPDQTVTIEFTKMQNPKEGGTYLLGINVFPSRKDEGKQFLGYGRLVFHAS
jgi:Protein of unknown function (DUF2808)